MEIKASKKIKKQVAKAVKKIKKNESTGRRNTSESSS